MGASRTSFEKLQRDRAKKAKAAAKREKRLERGQDMPDGEPVDGDSMDTLAELAPGEEIPADQLLKMVADLHERFENEEISFDEFEERKTELFAMLSVD
jgi:hypothetical protein